jgi:hypothetical protein
VTVKYESFQYPDWLRIITNVDLPFTITLSRDGEELVVVASYEDKECRLIVTMNDLAWLAGDKEYDWLRTVP